MKAGTVIHRLCLIISFLSLIASAVSAEENIYYQGLHFGKAWIKVNGRMVKLTPGQVSAHGFELLSMNEHEIVVKADGRRYRYAQGSSEGQLFEEKVLLQRDPGSGGYWSKGHINGRPVTFIVDTGATYVVLSKKTARTLKIKRGSKEVRMNTASKQETAYEVILESVRVGGIELKNIPALITRHDHPGAPLLGMSYLKHVNMIHADDQLLLQYDGE